MDLIRSIQINNTDHLLCTLYSVARIDDISDRSDRNFLMCFDRQIRDPLGPLDAEK